MIKCILQKKKSSFLLLFPGRSWSVIHPTRRILPFEFPFQKPENILLMGVGPERGCIKITDMGMARTFHSPLVGLTEVDAVVVTCWYRAPELFLGACHYTKAIDIFSVGCIFAELLTNMPIFNCPPDSLQSRSTFQRNQLDKMLSVLGYPTYKDWDELLDMPLFPLFQKEFPKSRSVGNNFTLNQFIFIRLLCLQILRL